MSLKEGEDILNITKGMLLKSLFNQVLSLEEGGKGEEQLNCICDNQEDWQKETEEVLLQSLTTVVVLTQPPLSLAYKSNCEILETHPREKIFKASL